MPFDERVNGDQSGGYCHMTWEGQSVLSRSDLTSDAYQTGCKLSPAGFGSGDAASISTNLLKVTKRL